MSDPEQPDLPGDGHIPEPADPSRTRHDALRVQMRELTRRHEAVLTAAEREAREIIDAARRDVEHTLGSARARLAALSGRVQATVPSAVPFGEALSDPAEAAHVDLLDLEADAVQAPLHEARQATRQMPGQPRADVGALHGMADILQDELLPPTLDLAQAGDPFQFPSEHPEPVDGRTPDAPRPATASRGAPAIAGPPRGSDVPHAAVPSDAATARAGRPVAAGVSGSIASPAVAGAIAPESPAHAASSRPAPVSTAAGRTAPTAVPPRMPIGGVLNIGVPGGTSDARAESAGGAAAVRRAGTVWGAAMPVRHGVLRRWVHTHPLATVMTLVIVSVALAIVSSSRESLAPYLAGPGDAPAPPAITLDAEPAADRTTDPAADRTTDPAADRTTDPAADPSAHPAPAGVAAPATERPVLRLEARRDVWVQVTLDGRQDAGRTLRAGDRRDISGGRDIVIRAGDAGALWVAVGTDPLQPMGADGRVLTRRFQLGPGVARGANSQLPTSNAQGLRANSQLPIPNSQGWANSQRPTSNAQGLGARGLGANSHLPTSNSQRSVAMARDGMARAASRAVPEPVAPEAQILVAAERWFDSYYRRLPFDAFGIVHRPSVADTRPPDARLPDGLADVSRAFDDVQVQVVADRAVYSARMIEHEATGADAARREARVSQVWVRRDAGWRLTDVRLLGEGATR